MLTAEQIRGMAPHARDDYVDALVGGEEIFKKWGFNSPNRLAALLATIMHETGGLTIVRENTGWTKANLKIFSTSRAAKILPFVGNKVKEADAAYGDRMGNERDGTNDDDGWRFRGGGMIQLTGRDSYERAGRAIGVDLGMHPELIEDAKVSLQAACWEMSQFLPQCDLGQRGWRAVCNGINRGNVDAGEDPIGWRDRQAQYAKICRVLKVDGVPDDSLRRGDQDAVVLAMQQRLAALGYAPGAADGIFGSRTRSAVLTFQAENDLPTTGAADPATRAALYADAAKPMPLGDRATATVDDLRKAGSETIAHADSIKAVAGGLGVVSSLAGGADVTQAVTAPVAAPVTTPPVDVIAATRDVVTEINSWRSITDSIADVFHWATSHGWVLGIVIAFAFYRWGNQIQWRRLLDHRSGASTAR